ncbi:MAG TPA: hypothetical protein VH107_13580 [Lacipirellulaceae bacterium]|nr:hypothetical protein [Lacipirellulaceae bacterium]
MTAALLYQPTRRLEDIEHLGAYFETPQLIAAIATERMGSLNQTIVAEPVYCDGSWGVWSPSAVVQRDPQTIIVDSTLLGREDGVADLLVRLPPAATVLRIHSGLKLFQQGLELADVGIVTAYSQEATKASATADALRKLRSITGLGLGFAEIAALELPVFLDPTPTKSFEDAVFSNNARLASAVSENNLLFEPIVHPSLLAKVAKAPYCTFRLRRPSGAAYERLQIAIAKTIRDMNLLVANAGSFGFRGHRFEIVRPENGAPFLRVALGCRAGRSLEGVIAMMRGLAGRAEL